ncbi:putative transcription factor WD40-like family [Helianthus annuus]|nr:putative transcription factor WD40-like family [Helianthus annuus]KAJ0436310.1 putative transcription factor WD40-like family [Helianthus annuus]KAJ0828867.1 putative transcription factor WD40-like family [Helianthus annuus]
MGAVEPGSPHMFYSCGEDGFVQRFDLRSNSSTKLFCCSTFTGTDNLFSSNILSLNSIIIDPRHPNYFYLGDCDQYARVYDIRKLPSNKDAPVETFCPKHLIKTREMQITGLSYSNTSKLLVSCNGELIYLFQKNMGLGPYPCSVARTCG